MNSNEHFSLTTFTETTKKVCTCSAISIFLIVLFIISPLSSFFLTSVFMKIITIILLSYTLYLNYQQTSYLRNASQLNLSKEVSSQLNINIVCSYVFTLFIGLLVIFVSKSFF
jgi:hypothetical protein